IVFNGNYYHEAAMHSALLQNQFQCDSLVRLEIFLNPSDTTDLTATLCEGDSIEFNGNYYHEAGMLSALLQNQFQCDSLVRLEIFLNPSDTTDLTATLCEGDSIEFNGDYYHEAGMLSALLQNQFQCDSLVRLEINIIPLPDISLGSDTSIYNVNEFLLNPGEGFTQYLWHDGSTASTFLVEGSNYLLGTHLFYVQVSGEGDCMNQDSIFITILEWNGISNPLNLSVRIYPNPGGDYLHIEINQPEGEFRLSVMNEAGELLLENRFQGNTHTLPLHFLPAGNYLLELSNGTLHEVFHYIKIKP
ncbi:MAG: T9SS type A sorting domain-containing protein, partial [Bacteroidales bacterium]|nr:T9SS type A sorting domain-containing protein [Bacteroidales bacterium]